MRPGRALLKVLAAAVALPGVFWACTPVGTVRNEHFLEEAERAFLREDHAKAAGHYEAFLADNPGDPRRPEVLLRAGVCRLASGRPDEALRSFERALASSPSRPLRWEIRFRQAVAHRVRGDAERALEGFRAVASGSQADRGERILNDELHYEYALALFRAGDWAAGHAQLAAVSGAGPYGRKKKLRSGLGAFAVQVGAFSSEGRARTQAALLKSHTRAAEVRSVPGEAALFVVRAGPFTRYADARREADRLKGLGFPDAFVIP